MNTVTLHHDTERDLFYSKRDRIEFSRAYLLSHLTRLQQTRRRNGTLIATSPSGARLVLPPQSYSALHASR